MSKKLAFIIIDGMADVKIKTLGNKTPLEFAETSGMDLLARHGLSSKIYTVNKGFMPESDVANLCLLGYDLRNHVGRAAFEAEGMNIKLTKNQVAFRANFVKLNEKQEIENIRGYRLSTSLNKKLCKKLSMRIQGIKIKVIPGESYRALVIFSGKNLSTNVSNTHPFYKKIEGTRYSMAMPSTKKGRIKLCRALSPDAILTAYVVNQFTERARRILSALNNPTVNGIVLRDASKQDKNPTLFSKKYGLKMLTITERFLEKGLSKFLGIDIIDSLNTQAKTLKQDCKRKLNLFFKNYNKYDGFYIFLKGPDEPSHDKNPSLKARMIEIIDENLIIPLIEKLSKKNLLKNTIICITTDHTTSSLLGAHTDAPVPVVVFDSKHDDNVKAFNEKACKKGKLPVNYGKDLMPYLVKIMKD